VSKEKLSFVISTSEVIVAMTDYQGPSMTGIQCLSVPNFSYCLAMQIPLPGLPIYVAKFPPCTLLFQSILKVASASASKMCN
jgi:hypothetical protein